MKEMFTNTEGLVIEQNPALSVIIANEMTLYLRKYLLLFILVIIE